MKTTRNYTALSLALLFAATLFASTAFAGKTPGGIAGTSCIRYTVNVIINNEKPLCNTYLIEIRNERGVLVAPAKVYTPGVTQYAFYERGPVEGFRIARLVRAEFGDRYICEYEFFAKPVIQKGRFENGQNYRFDIIPSMTPVKE
jgi:hypothetical protein